MKEVEEFGDLVAERESKKSERLSDLEDEDEDS